MRIPIQAAGGVRAGGALMAVLLAAPSAVLAGQTQEDTNKALARRFYEQVWFSPNLDAVDDLVASEYVVHDIGDRKAAVEPAAEQKAIADFFWRHGTMGGRIDFQIAEGDLVATRWQWEYEPRSWWMKPLSIGARNPIPIVNVFRFQDGKIVEIWNHRHDIDTAQGNFFFLRGFGAGALVAGVAGFGAGRWRRRGRGAGVPSGAA